MSSQSTVVSAAATDQLVVRSGIRSFLKTIFCDLAPHWFGHSPSQALKDILGCDLRTAERYFAGDRTPDAISLIQLINSTVGVRLVEAAVAAMPPDEALLFWQEMHRAAIRALIRTNNQLLLIDETVNPSPLPVSARLAIR